MTDNVTRRNFLKLSGLAAAAVTVHNSGCTESKAKSMASSKFTPTNRNVVVILCDQLRKDFLNIYGCNAVPTPNLDMLAANGVVFDNAITQSPVCAPARACMMTGRYVSNHGVWTNDVPFRKDLEYIAGNMNHLGYATGAFGKLHHYPADDPKGFSHTKQMEETRLGKKDDYYKYLKARHPEIKNILGNYNRTELVFNYPSEDYYEYFIASEAINFIDQSSAAGKPFFAWVSFQGPHTPYDPPREVKGTVNADKLPRPVDCDESLMPDVQKYRSAMFPPPGPLQWNMKIREAYGEMIHYIDLQVGRIIAELKARGLYENTTFLFSADHGDLIGDHNNNYKGPFPYEAQLAVPMVISNHPDLAKGRRSQSLVGNIDIPSTVLDIAGSDHRMGVSLSLLEQSQKEPAYARIVNFSEFCDSCKIVENRFYRYAYYPFTSQAQLFDKVNDPDELNNLAGQGKFAALEQYFLKQIMDFQLIAKGIRIEAHDFVPIQQQGLKDKYPLFEKDFVAAYPLTKHNIENLKKKRLDFRYNEFIEKNNYNVKAGY